MRPIGIALAALALAACGGGGSSSNDQRIVLAGSCTYAAQADQSDRACQSSSVPASSVDLVRAVKEAECNAQPTHAWTTGKCPDTGCLGCCSIDDQDGVRTTLCYYGSAYAGISASSCPAGAFWTTAPP